MSPASVYFSKLFFDWPCQYSNLYKNKRKLTYLASIFLFPLCLSAILWFNDFFLFPGFCAQDVWLLSQIPSLFTDFDILKRFPWPCVLPDLEKFSIFSDFSLTVHSALLVLNGLVALWLSVMWELIPGPNSRHFVFQICSIHTSRSPLWPFAAHHIQIWKVGIMSQLCTPDDMGSVDGSTWIT